MRRAALACSFALALLLACKDPGPQLVSDAAAAPPPKPPARAGVSDALLAPRPSGGEYFGLYLVNQKVGYVYTDVSFLPGSKDKARAVNEFYFRAKVGQKESIRQVREERVYEAKPGGRLISFRVEQTGDGGDQTLEGTFAEGGFKVVRKRPDQPSEVFTIAAVNETIEDADQARVAILRNKTVEGRVLDGTDLESYKTTTQPGAAQSRMVAGVKVELKTATSLNEKEKVPTEYFVDSSGRMIEVNFGATMRAISESEQVAKSLDQVEVFGLTRVVLPKDAPETARQLPGRFLMVVTGLPEKFHRNTYRQSFKKLEGDKVEVVITAEAPKGKGKLRPQIDPNGGANLKSTIIVEAANPDIVAKMKEIVGAEKDAYRSALKINEWVFKSVKSDYGASADRATDVLRQMKGDCTEHALLAVALLRAAGIPAKRVDGVVYLKNEDNVPALYWHEWVEAFVGEWTQLDPTFGQPVADATHFAVGEEGNAEITVLIGALKVVDVR
jgi:hypothetical protein